MKPTGGTSRPLLGDTPARSSSWGSCIPKAERATSIWVRQSSGWEKRLSKATRVLDKNWRGFRASCGTNDVHAINFLYIHSGGQGNSQYPSNP
jgi:hypothetical protein